MRRVLLTILYCISLPTGWLFSQELRQIKFSVYGQYPVKGLAYSPLSVAAQRASATKVHPVAIETHFLERVGPYEFKGGNKILFKDTRSGRIQAEVTLPTTSDEWLLIFIKNPNYDRNRTDDFKFYIYAFDDSSRHLAGNNLTLLNLSGKRLYTLLDEQRLILNAGESSNHPAQKSLRIQLWTAEFEGRELMPALIKRYQFNQESRYLLIFFPAVLSGSTDLDVRALSETKE